MKNNPLIQSRRNFIKASTTFATFAILPGYRSIGYASPNDRINLAVIGIGNQGNRDRNQMVKSGHCNIVALCDVDMEGAHTHEARYKHGLASNPPEGKQAGGVSNIKAKGFTDFRKMFDEMADDIDAVLIATPDHSHFSAAMLAMSLGKHVYVEKPLAHTFGQAQRLMDMAQNNKKLVTQMGNQGHSGANYFQFKAWSEDGLLDDISRVTANMNYNRPWYKWGEGIKKYPESDVPPGMDWELWHDSVIQDRPFSDLLHPGKWRGWFEFGSGCFGDWGPHVLDTCHRFLELGMPHTVSVEYRDGVNKRDLVYPSASTIKFQFPERGSGKPACDVTWYDGADNVPVLEAEYTDEGQEMLLKNPGKVLYGKDLVFHGGHHGEPLKVVPHSKYMDIRRSLPEFSQKNSNHYANFLLACKGDEESRSPFSVSGELTQVFALGIIAQRLGETIEFDAERGEITNNEVADALLDPAPRPGWEEYYELVS